MQTTLSLGGSKKVFDQYNLTADSIQDSRCPLAVECVWEGSVTVYLTLHAPGMESQVLQLCHGNEDDCEAVSSVGELRVRLDSITPYPITVIEQSDYRVHLSTSPVMK